MTLLVLVAGTNLPSPLWTVYEREFGFGPLLTTVAFACYAVALVPAVLLAGPLADAVGARRVVGPALLLAAAGCAMLATATSLTGLLAGRVLQGIAVGACSGALTAGLLATQPNADHRRGALLATVATTAGAGVGPVAAGALTTYAPHPTTLCYLAEIVLLGAVVVVGVPALPPAPTSHIRYRPRRPAIPAAGRGLFTRAAVCSALTWAVVYVLLALAPAYIATLIHTHNLLVAAGPAGLLLLVAAATQLLRGTLTPAVALRAGTSILLIGVLGLILLGSLPSIPLLLADLTVIGIGHGLTFMGALRQATATAASHEQTSVAAAFFSITYIGGSVPVIAVGLLTTALPLTTAVQIFAATIALALLAVTARRKPPAETVIEKAGVVATHPEISASTDRRKRWKTHCGPD